MTLKTLNSDNNFQEKVLDDPQELSVRPSVYQVETLSQILKKTSLHNRAIAVRNDGQLLSSRHLITRLLRMCNGQVSQNQSSPVKYDALEYYQLPVTTFCACNSKHWKSIKVMNSYKLALEKRKTTTLVQRFIGKNVFRTASSDGILLCCQRRKNYRMKKNLKFRFVGRRIIYNFNNIDCKKLVTARFKRKYG